MKKLAYILSSFVILGLLAVSCDLTEDPQAQAGRAIVFGDEAGLRNFTYSFYDYLPDNGSAHRINVTHDHSAKMSIGTYEQGAYTINTSTSWSWSSIRNVNYFIKYNTDPDVAEDVRNNYTGIARLFRAYLYYDKLITYGCVPWIDKPLDPTDEELYKSQDNRDVIIRNIMDDLDYAAENILEDKITPYSNTVNKWTALALKSRICLFEGTFRKYHEGDVTLWTLPADAQPASYYLQLAADAAEELMDLGPHKLYTTGHPDYDYQNLFSNYDADAGEFILAIDYDYSLKCFHDASGVALLPVCGRNSPTRAFVDHYLMADGTRYSSKSGWSTKTFADQVAGRDPRLHQTIRIPGYNYTVLTTNRAKFCDMDCSLTGYSINKFVMSPDNLTMNNIRSNSYNDLPVIRLAEVYLIFAEAKAELGNLTQQDLDKSVNKLRQRAGMPDLKLTVANGSPDPYLASSETGYPNVGGANKGVILEIRRERVVELALEGLRYADLLRWAAGERITKGLYGMYFPGAGEYDWDNDGNADICLYSGSKPSTSATFVYKIGTDITLTQGNKGYVDPRPTYTFSFDPERDYLYPIPSNERVMNHSLLQNPGWNDGLDF